MLASILALFWSLLALFSDVFSLSIFGSRRYPLLAARALPSCSKNASATQLRFFIALGSISGSILVMFCWSGPTFFPLLSVAHPRPGRQSHSIQRRQIAPLASSLTSVLLFIRDITPITVHLAKVFYLSNFWRIYFGSMLDMFDLSSVPYAWLWTPCHSQMLEREFT